MAIISNDEHYALPLFCPFIMFSLHYGNSLCKFKVFQVKAFAGGCRRVLVARGEICSGNS